MPSVPTAFRVLKSLKPGQGGTLKLLRRYGESLVCVRYRLSPDRATRYTTIELVIEEAAVQRRLTKRSIVGVKLDWREAPLQAQAKALGAKWDASAKLWRMTLADAEALNLTNRIRPELPKCGSPR